MVIVYFKEVIRMSENKSLQYVTFQIGKETYAINTTFIVRIENDKKVRKVPNVNEEIRGIITVEEDIVPLVDLRIKFNIPSERIEEIPYIIVCKLIEEDIRVGFVVDEVIEVIDVPNEAEFNSLNDFISSENLDFIQGVYRPDAEKSDKNEELLIILDAQRLVNKDNIEEIKNHIN